MPARQRFSLSVLIVFVIALSAVCHAQAALQFVPMAPCRAVDTRNTGGPIIGGQFRSFPVATECSLPSNVAAYALNVTLVPDSPVYVVTVWPAGQNLPNSSLMNSYDGRVKANAAIVPAGTPNQEVNVYVSDTANIVLDVDGYFVPATDSALAFYSLTPCRVADTRSNYGGSYLQAGVAQTFDVLAATSCDIPDSAVAYSLNFTVVPRNDAVWVFTAWPTGDSPPATSTLNDPTGTVVANAALLEAGTNGKIETLASADTDLVIDINGYFAAPATGGMSLYTANTCRVWDTRQHAGAFNGELTVDVLGSQCQPPPSAVAYVLNATVVPQEPVGFLSLWPDTEQQPNYSTLNAWDAAVTSNMAIVPTLNGKIDAASAGLTNLVLDMASYFAPSQTLAITTTSLPDGNTGQPYSQTLMATGGEPPYAWTVTNGSLPPGLSLASDSGIISGTPTTPGGYPFTVKVTDALWNSSQQDLHINVATGPLMITTTSLPQGTVSVAYNADSGCVGRCAAIHLEHHRGLVAGWIVAQCEQRADLGYAHYAWSFQLHGAGAGLGTKHDHGAAADRNQCRHQQQRAEWQLRFLFQRIQQRESSLHGGKLYC